MDSVALQGIGIDEERGAVGWGRQRRHHDDCSPAILGESQRPLDQRDPKAGVGKRRGTAKRIAEDAGSEPVVAGRKRFKGMLEGLEGDEILLRQDGELVRIPLAAVRKAKLTLSEALLKRAAGQG